MRLSPQVVDLGGLDGVDDVDQAVAIDEVPVVKDHAPTRVRLRVFIQMRYTASVEGGTSTDNSMDFIPFLQQELCQIRPILSCYASQQGDLPVQAILTLSIIMQVILLHLNYIGH